jgi:type I restriction enzyme M protein
MSEKAVNRDCLVSRREVAAACGVAVQAVSNWMSRHQDFPRLVSHDGREGFRLQEMASWLDGRAIPTNARVDGETSQVTYGDRFRARLGLQAFDQSASHVAGGAGGQPGDEVEVTGWTDTAVWRSLERLGRSIDPATYRDGLAGLLWLRQADPDGWRQVRVGSRAPDAALPVFERVWDREAGSLGASPLTQSESAQQWWTQHLPAVVATIEDGLSLAAGSAASRSRPQPSDAELLDLLLERFAAAEGALEGEFLTPRSVAMLMARLADPRPGDRVLDPCCGTGELLLAAEAAREAAPTAGGQRYRATVRVGKAKGAEPVDTSVDEVLHGWAVGEHTWRVARLRVATHGVRADLGSRPWDALEHAGEVQGEYDIVLSNPPFRPPTWPMPDPGTHGNWPYGDPRPADAAFAWVQLAAQYLALGGRGVLVMPSSATDSARPRDRAIREALVTRGVVRAVVGLPAGLFHETRTPVTLWVLGPPGKAWHNEVLTMEVTTDMAQADRRVLSLHPEVIDRVVKTYQSWAQPPSKLTPRPDLPHTGFAAAVPIQQIAENAFSLNPRAYLTMADSRPLQSPQDAISLAASRLAAAQARAVTADEALKAYLKDYL